jgi:hypothetical protein
VLGNKGLWTHPEDRVAVKPRVVQAKAEEEDTAPLRPHR